MSQNASDVNSMDAAVDLQDSFVKIAARLRPRDPATQDDLVQEMGKAVVEMGGRHPLALYRSIAVRRAKDSLRNWFRRSPVDRALYESRQQRDGRFDVFDEAQKQEKFLKNLARAMDWDVPAAEDLIEWLKRSA